MQQNKKYRGGFSLIEVMVVVVIIGLLAGAVALKVGGYIGMAEGNRVKSDLSVIVDAIELYKLEHKRLPTQEEGLAVLDIDNRNDPWNRPYEYNVPGPNGEPFEVFTLGQDGRDGGEEADADIYSWQLGEDQQEG